MSTIENIESVIQLEVLRQKNPSVSLDELVRRTHSVTYGETTFTQSGHRIASVKFIENQPPAPLNRLLSHYEQHDPSRIQKHDNAIEAHGDGLVNRDTPVHSGYDIEIELTPFKAAP